MILLGPFADDAATLQVEQGVSITTAQESAAGRVAIRKIIAGMAEELARIRQRKIVMLELRSHEVGHGWRHVERRRV